ncbi:MAG: PorV/PorQ family protein [Bacteroidota bacterium]
MKRNIKRVISLVLVCTLSLTAFISNAGNEDRTGQSGAAELLINPWARGTGWGNAGVANSTGIESMFTNVAGLSFTNKTQISFMNTQYLQGSGAKINAFGIAQKVSETGVLGISVFAMGFGDIPVTTTENPEGGIGNFSPSLMNVSVSYANSFSDAIHGGFSVKIINESISDISATGVAFDAGIQYVSGKYNNLHFGIALKNIGTPLSFNGDGLSVRGLINGSSNNLTLQQRSGEFELPSMLTLGFAYDFLWAKKEKSVASDASGGAKPKKKNSDLSADNAEHRLTLAGAFISNAFSKDQFAGGVEYSWNNMLQLRAGYCFETNMYDSELGKTVYTGVNVGGSVVVPMNKAKGSYFSIDYSYRATKNFSGCHTIGAVINL